MNLKRSDGFTLIECLISIILLVIVLAGGMKFYFNASDIMTMAMHKKIAMEMATQAMEQMKDSGYTCLSYPTPGGCPTTAPLGTWETATPVTFNNGNFSFTAQKQRRITNVEGASPNINKKVEVQFSWSESGKSTPNVINLATNMAP